MNTIKTTLLALVALITFSCNKDNDNNIVGDWKIQNYTETVTNADGSIHSETKYNYDNIKYVRFEDSTIDIITKDSTINDAYSYYTKDGILYTTKQSTGNVPVQFGSESSYSIGDGLLKVDKPYNVFRRR